MAISVACPGGPAHRGQRWIAARTSGYVLALMTSRPLPGDDDLVPVALRVRMAAVLPPLVFGAACAVQAALAFGTPHTVSPAEWA